MEYCKVFKPSTRTFEIQQGLLANAICTPANLPARSTISDIVRQDLQFTWKKLSVHPAESLTHENHEKDIGDGLMWKMKPWTFFFISIARRPEGNYFFPLWNRGNVACHRSQLTIFQYEKPFAQAANPNMNRNLLGANCQSKYQHCVPILQSGAQTNNRFHCKLWIQ